MYGAVYTGRECTGWGIETWGCNISPLGSSAKISPHGEIFALDPKFLTCCCEYTLSILLLGFILLNRLFD